MIEYRELPCGRLLDEEQTRLMTSGLFRSGEQVKAEARFTGASGRH